MKFKVEIIVSLIVLAAVGLAIGIIFSLYSLEESEVTGSSYPAKKEMMVKETPASNFTVLIPMGQNICEGCHLSGKKFIPQAYEAKPHVEGGAYCLRCHKIDHNTHPINNNVTCERCHGTTTPQLPTFQNGTISCAECHDYPDPLKASNGNLIVIHRPRNIDCTRCHTDTCLTCHNEIKSDKNWEKRLNHFNTLLNTAK